MRPNGTAKGNQQIGALMNASIVTIGTADGKIDCLMALIAPAADPAGQMFGGNVLAAWIKADKDGVVRHQPQQQFRLILLPLCAGRKL